MGCVGVSNCVECDPAGTTCVRRVTLLEQEAEIARLREQIAKTEGRAAHLDEMLSKAQALIERAYEATGAPKGSDLPLDVEVDKLRQLVDDASFRPPLRAFALEMERALRANDYKGGWHACKAHWLIARMCVETAELIESLDSSDRQRASFVEAVEHLKRASDALNRFGPHAKPCGGRYTKREAADVANFAMMVADLCGEQDRAR